MKALSVASTLKSRLAQVTAIAIMAIAALAAVQPSARAGDDGWFCENHSIYSYANGKFVSAEIGWGADMYGVLRARADRVGPWEGFRICWITYNNSTQYTIQSLANGLYVSAELGWGGSYYAMLRARTSASGPAETGPWERFYFYHENPWGTPRLVSLANGLYVSAELAYPCDLCGVLRARQGNPGPWEAIDIFSPA